MIKKEYRDRARGMLVLTLSALKVSLDICNNEDEPQLRRIKALGKIADVFHNVPLTINNGETYGDDVSKYLISLEHSGNSLLSDVALQTLLRHSKLDMDSVAIRFFADRHMKKLYQELIGIRSNAWHTEEHNLSDEELSDVLFSSYQHILNGIQLIEQKILKMPIR